MKTIFINLQLIEGNTMRENETDSARKTRKVYTIAIATIMIGLTCFSIGYRIAADTPGGFPTIIEPGSLTNPASYVVFKDGSTTYARNGLTGAISFSSSSSRTVIQETINAIGNTSGGTLFLKLASYSISTELNVTKSNLTIIADPGTILTSSVMPILTLYGSDTYGNDGWPLSGRLYNIHISNIQFFYTGSVATGSFIRIHHVNLGAYFIPGQFTLTNILVHGGYDIPTNVNFVGVYSEDMNGVEFSDVSVTGFGTGVKITTPYWPSYGQNYQNDGNHYHRLHIGVCRYGVWYTNAGCGLEVYDVPKFIVCSQFGIYVGYNASIYQLQLNSPHFEGFADYNISGATQAFIKIDNDSVITVINGWFNGIDNYGYYANGTQATFNQCRFNGVPYPYYLYYSDTILISNRYVGETTIVTNSGSLIKSMFDDYVTENRGVGETNGEHYYQFAHGLSAWPNLVVAAFNATGYGDWYWTCDATYITIYVETDGYWYIWWYATTNSGG